MKLRQSMLIEFQERRGFGGGRTLRVDRAEIVRIELDDEPSDDIIGATTAAAFA
jgi:hypothetical protein